MRIIKVLLVVLVLLASSAAYAQNGSLGASTVEVLEGQELLIYQKSSGKLNSFKTEATTKLLSSGTKNIKFLNSKLATASLGSSSGAASIKNVQKSSLLDACEKIKSAQLGCEINFVVKLLATPNDTNWSILPGLKKISADKAWDHSTGSRTVKVAVIDTGVDYTHPDLASNKAINAAEIPNNGIDDDANGFADDYYGYNFSGSNANPYDDHNHGTHVAGTIGALGNNGLGVVGVNWQVGIIPVKVLAANGSGTLSAVIQGINYALVRGADVLNLSLGGTGYSQIFYDAISNVNNAGALFVAAAGNETNNNDVNQVYPSGYNLPNVISVAAATSADQLASFSNFGATTVHIAAPGVSIASTLAGGGYGYMSGTSMATPHVAGAAALLKAFSPSSSMLQIKSALLNNGDIVSGLNGKVLTSARMNVVNALASLSNGAVPPVQTPPPADDDDNADEPVDSPNPPPGDGVNDPDDGDQIYPINYIGVQQKVANNQSKITVFLLDSEDYYISGAKVSLVCAGKLLGEKLTGDIGTVKFSVKLKKSKVKCEIIATNELGSMSKQVSVKKMVRRR